VVRFHVEAPSFNGHLDKVVVIANPQRVADGGVVVPTP
jgi:hypothetical protein